MKIVMNWKKFAVTCVASLVVGVGLVLFVLELGIDRRLVGAVGFLSGYSVFGVISVIWPNVEPKP